MIKKLFLLGVCVLTTLMIFSSLPIPAHAATKPQCAVTEVTLHGTVAPTVRCRTATMAVNPDTFVNFRVLFDELLSTLLEWTHRRSSQLCSVYWWPGFAQSESTTRNVTWRRFAQLGQSSECLVDWLLECNIL